MVIQYLKLHILRITRTVLLSTGTLTPWPRSRAMFPIFLSSQTCGEHVCRIGHLRCYELKIINWTIGLLCFWSLLPFLAYPDSWIQWTPVTQQTAVSVSDQVTHLVTLAAQSYWTGSCCGGNHVEDRHWKIFCNINILKEDTRQCNILFANITPGKKTKIYKKNAKSNLHHTMWLSGLFVVFI